MKLKESEARIAHLEKELKDKEDNLLMSEFTVKNRDDKIEKLENEIDALKAERLYNCDECAYCSEKETQLKSHMAEDHTHQCPECDNNFVGKKKLEKHTCRIHVTNPTSEQFGLYTKDWYERDKCIRIFDNALKEEVILLHCENCLECEVCTELPLEFHKEQCFKDAHGIIHLRKQDFME